MKTVSLMDPVRIQDAVEQDVAACLKIDHTIDSNAVWQLNDRISQQEISVQFNWQELPRSITLEHPADADLMLDFIREQQCFLIATTEDRVLGYLLMRTDTVHHIGLISTIVIDTPWRQQSLARRLLRSAASWAAERSDAQRLIAEVYARNDPAIRFFNSRGFRFSGYSDAYFRHDEIAFFMSALLPQVV